MGACWQPATASASFQNGDHAPRAWPVTSSAEWSQNSPVAQKVAQKTLYTKTLAHKKIQSPLSDWIF
jgi:hypothetical protein